MKQVDIREAKTQFSRLLRRVAAGEEITIAKRDVPVGRLVRVPTSEPMRKLGAYRGTLKIPDDFDAPLPDEILDLFEGREPKKTESACSSRRHLRKNDAIDGRPRVSGVQSGFDFCGK